jgi:WD40 repeat protein/serine/threonine protein kinase
MAVDPARVKSLFLAASDLADPLERATYLDRECGGDDALRARVEVLLRADAPPRPPGDGATLPSSPDASAAATGTLAPASQTDQDPDRTSAHRPADAPGLVLAGRYKLVEPIGEGGMGTVWMAQQVEPVKRAVAVKLVKAGMDSRAVLARFEAERQALALMDHPNIARVLDAGMTADGRPYFVMELVKGVPITEFCDARKLTLRERLELFVPVCQAIQHAHQKGVIHRDIKPSNVLVTLYDDHAVPKVIDFGVAKAAGTPLTDKTMMTGFGAVVGTPEYMSPEQASFNQLDVDTRSDVYSLGVLLYELLTGSPPHPRKELEKAGLLEVLRVIREQDPPRPSARLSTSHALASIAAVRGTEPARLTRLVRGELDWLVMKALEKDRARRYETANALAAEVQRFLAGEPVQAVPPSAGYRLRKFVRRHRTGVLTALGFALLLLAAAAVSSWQAVIATRAEREANDRRRDAEGARAALRRSLYDADLALAQVGWERGDVPRVRALLDGQRPGPGEPDLRGFEWHYWGRMCRSELRSVRLPGAGPAGAVLSADGQICVGVYAGPGPENLRQGEIRVWDPTTGDRRVTLVPYPGDMLHGGCPVLSQDGRSLCVPTYAPLKVWDTATGRERLVLNPPPGRFLVTACALDRDGSRVAALLTEYQTQIWGTRTVGKVWALDGGKELLKLPELKGGPLALAYSPDDGRLAALVVTVEETGHHVDGEVIVWDGGTGRETLRIKGAVTPGTNGSLVWSPDGKLVVAAGGNPDRTAAPAVRVWDARSGELRFELTGPSGWVTQLAFSPDGGRLAAASADKRVWLWDLAGPNVGIGRSPVRVYPGHDGPALTVAFGADGRHLYSVGADGVVKVWDGQVTDRRILDRGSPSDQVISLATDAGGTRCGAVWASAKGALEVRVWDRDGNVTFSKSEVGWVEENLNALPAVVVIAPDASRAALLTRKFGPHRPPGEKRTYETALRVWDLRTGKEVFSRSGSGGWFEAVAFSRDGRRLAVSHAHVDRRDDGGEVARSRLIVHDLDEMKEVLSTAVEGYAAPLALSPDGRRVAGGVFAWFRQSPDDGLRIWDVATGDVVPARGVPPGRFTRVTFDPTGALLAASVRGSVSVIDASTGRERWSLKGLRGTAVDVAFSPDGTRLAAIGRVSGVRGSEVRLWDLATGREVLSLESELGSPSARASGRLAFGEGGHRIYQLDHGDAIAPQTVIRVWDATPLPGEKPQK